MSESVRPPALLPGDTLSRSQVWRRWLLKTFPGRALVLGAVIKAITWPLGTIITLPGWLEAADMVGSLALLFAIAYGFTRLAVWAKRRLLWRVRRKLILSYVFVGVVPALLVITFFLLAGLILAFNISSYLVQSRVRNLTDQARFLAQTTLLEVQRSGTPDAIAEALERKQASTETRYPYLSIALVPVKDVTCKVEGAPEPAGKPAVVDRLRRFQRHHGLQRSRRQRRRRAGHPAGDAGRGIARGDHADVGRGARHADDARRHRRCPWTDAGDREPHADGLPPSRLGPRA